MYYGRHRRRRRLLSMYLGLYKRKLKFFNLLLRLACDDLRSLWWGSNLARF